MNLLLRRLSILLALVLLLGAMYVASKLKAQKKAPERVASTEILKDVLTIEVSNESVPTELEIQGRLSAFEKMDIFTEVPGKLSTSNKPIKVGNYFKKGAVLLQIDNEEAQFNLLSQKSNLMNAITQLLPDLKLDYPESLPQWKNYLDQFDVKQSLQELPMPQNEKEKYFIASKNLHGQYYAIKSAEKRLAKYTIYSPFSGVITASAVNPGATVQPGQRLGTLMNNSNYELEATINLSDLKYIKTGHTVALYSDDIEGSWNGKVVRISDQIDPSTQTVIAFVNVYGKNLREGMYLRGKIKTGNIPNAASIPLKFLIDQKAVYQVKDSILYLVPIEIEKAIGSNAIVKGIPSGTSLLNQKLVGAYEGMKVNPIPSTNSLSQNN